MRLWDVQTGKEIDKITGLEGPARSVAFSPDGTRFYASTGAKGLREWDTATRTPISLPRNGQYLSPHGLRGLTFGEVNQKPTGFVWTLGTGTSLATFPLPEPPGAPVIAFAGQDSRIVIVSSAGTLFNCDLPKRRLDGNRFFPGRPLCIACAPDQLLAVGGPAEGRLRAFNPPGRKVVRDFEPRGQGPIHCLAFLPDSRRLVSGGDDGTVRAWDAGTGKQSAEFTGHVGPVAALTVLPDGLHALSAGRDGSLRLWDLTKLPPPAVTSEPSAPPDVPVGTNPPADVAVRRPSTRWPNKNRFLGRVFSPIASCSSPAPRSWASGMRFPGARAGSSLPGACVSSPSRFPAASGCFT